MLFLIILEIILLTILILVAINFFNIVFRGFAPFFTAKQEVINNILENINIKEGQVIYELGAGKANFLKTIEKKNLNNELIGVEYSIWPYLTTKSKLKSEKSKIKLIRKDLFKINLEKANIIYCYLTPTMMNKLSEKIRKECKKGTTIISYLFSIPNLPLHKTIGIEDNNIYIYEI